MPGTKKNRTNDRQTARCGTAAQPRMPNSRGRHERPMEKWRNRPIQAKWSTAQCNRPESARVVARYRPLASHSSVLSAFSRKQQDRKKFSTTCVCSALIYLILGINSPLLCGNEAEAEVLTSKQKCRGPMIPSPPRRSSWTMAVTSRSRLFQEIELNPMPASVRYT
jgi:hypothetical protein